MTPKPMDTPTPSTRPARPWVAVLVAAGCAIVVAFQVALTLGAPLGPQHWAEQIPVNCLESSG